MPITNITTGGIGASGQVPNILYISTTDTISQVTVTGYLNKAFIQGIPMSDATMALVSTKVNPGDLASDVSWLEVHNSSGNWSLRAAGSSGVMTVTGTANRITSTGGANPVIDISAAYVGQTSVTTLGTIATGVWGSSATKIGLTSGGTNTSLTAAAGGVVYSTSSGMGISAVGTSGEVLVSGGTGAPTWTAPTYPVVVGAAGTLLRSDGTNWVATTSTYPNTNAVSTLLYASSANVMAALATVNRAALTTTSSGVPAWIALTDGQLVVGSTAGSPAAATISAGSGISVTNASNSITIAATNAGTVTSVSGTTNRITSTGGATPVIDISASYVGQSSLTTLGTVSSGVWNGTAVTVPYGGTGDASFTAYSVICGGTTSTGVLQSVSGVGTSGQVLTSNGASALPTWQAGGNVIVDQTSSPATMAVGSSYVADLGTLVTFNMPATVAFGTIFDIVGKGAGGWLIQFNTGQVANYNSTPTSSAGSLASSNRYNCIRLMCVTANTTFTVLGASGVITVA